MLLAPVKVSIETEALPNIVWPEILSEPPAMLLVIVKTEPETLPKAESPETLRVVKVALVPEAEVNLKVPICKLPEPVALVKVIPVAEAEPNMPVPDTCRFVSVALVPEALVNLSVVAKRLVPVALVKVRLAMVEEGARNSLVEAKPVAVMLAKVTLEVEASPRFNLAVSEELRSDRLFNTLSQVELANTDESVKPRLVRAAVVEARSDRLLEASKRRATAPVVA